MENQHLRKSILATLVKMSITDKNVTKEEFIFIKDVSIRLGIDESEIEGIINNYEKLSLKIPKEEKDRMSILYYLLFLMKIDGNANELEQNLVREIGFKLGFRDQMVENMIEVIKANVDKPVPEDSLLDNIKKYLN